MKLFITEQVKKNYAIQSILYKLLDNKIFGSCHQNRAKPAYETVHTTYMQYLQLVYDLPLRDLDFLFRFGKQNVDDEHATLDQFNTLAPVVSRSQLFQ